MRLVLKDERVIGEERLLTDLNSRIRGVNEGPDGALYVMTDGNEGQDPEAYAQKVVRDVADTTHIQRVVRGGITAARTARPRGEERGVGPPRATEPRCGQSPTFNDGSVSYEPPGTDLRILLCLRHLVDCFSIAAP